MALLDNFNRSDGELGSGWTAVNGYEKGDVNSNQHRAGGTSNSWAYWNASTFGPNCEASITITGVPSSNSGMLALRLTNTSGGVNGYLAGYHGGDGLYKISRFDANVATLLTSTPAGSFAAGTKLKFTANGSTLTLYADTGSGWSQVLQTTDSTYGTAGYIGLRALVNWFDTTYRGDDFNGGTLSGQSITHATQTDTAQALSIRSKITPATQTDVAQTLSIAGGNQRLGVYVGGQNTSAVADFGTWLNRTPDIAVEWLGGEAWANWTSPGYWIDPWDGLGYEVLFGMPMFPSGGSLAAGAAGDYDSHWTALGTYLATLTLDVIARPGWEFGGSWYQWYVDTAQKAADYATYFRRIVNALRAQVPTIKICWNPIWGWQPVDPTLAYPGDAYVDYIGIDVYDQSWIPNYTDPASRWADFLAATYGGDFWVDYCSTHKPLCLPEWGLSIRADGHGGGDNDYFVDAMADWIEANDIAFHAYFNYNDASGNFEIYPSVQFPLGSADYLARFGVPTQTEVTIVSGTETGTAQALSITKTIYKTITPATATEVAFELVYQQISTEVSITPSSETDVAQALAVTRNLYATLTPATETDTAQRITTSDTLIFPIVSDGTLDFEVATKRTLDFTVA